MKNLLFLLILITSSSYSQVQTELYVRVAVPSAVLYCGYQPSTVELTKKRVFFSCPEIEVDIKVKKRKKEEWTGYDKQGNEYKVRAGVYNNEFTILILPRSDSGLKAVQFSKADLCH